MPDFQNDLVLITCASGKQATEVIPHVLKSYKRLRLQVNSSGSKDSLSQKYPNAEVVQVDMADPKDCKPMLEGVTACFLVDPPFHPHETSLGYNVVDACLSQRSSGGPFTHLVYSSVLFPHLRKLLNHDCKRYVEEYLTESGLNYTIIQPTHMMEMFPLAMLMQQDNPTYPANWNPDTKFSFVTTKDIGEAAAKILTEREKHYYATYQFVSTPSPLNYHEVAEIASSVIGKKITVTQRSFEDATTTAIKMICGGEEPPQATKEIGSRMFLYYNDRGLVGNSNVLEWVLGRKPLDYKTWVEVKVKEIKEQ